MIWSNKSYFFPRHIKLGSVFGYYAQIQRNKFPKNKKINKFLLKTNAEFGMISTSRGCGGWSLCQE